MPSKIRDGSRMEILTRRRTWAVGLPTGWSPRRPAACSGEPNRLPGQGRASKADDQYISISIFLSILHHYLRSSLINPTAQLPSPNQISLILFVPIKLFLIKSLISTISHYFFSTAYTFRLTLHHHFSIITSSQYTFRF